MKSSSFMKGKDHYQYLTLREALLRRGEEVNFYGVVSEYEHPKATRGSDFICTMTVVDMSHENPGLRVLLFASTKTALPLVKVIGDIMRVHRVEMGDYKGEPQAIAKVNRKSSFLLFEGKNGNSYEPYQKAHNSYSFELHDEARLDIMRNWVGSHPLYTRVSDYLVPISGIKEGSYFDLCCKVFFVDDRVPDHSVIIHVWDGSDAMFRTLPLPFEDDDMENLSFAISKITWDAKSAATRDIFCGFPHVGTILPIVTDLTLDDLPAQLPQRGDWVKFRNLACRSQSGVLEAVFTRESKISLLSTDTELVKNCENLYEERILTELGRLPQSCPRPPESLTVTDYEHVPFTTLREILTFPKVTHQFRCLARVTLIWPSEVKNFCAKEGDNVHPQFVYFIKLTLEDPTARLQAYLYGENGAKFFNGHPPMDLHSDSPMVGALERKVQKLLGIAPVQDNGQTPFRNPPWIKFCLRSYYTVKSDPWVSRCFQIFGTTFPG